MILVGDALARLQQIENESVDCIVTSPPYFGLRDYGISGQIGLEHSIEHYLARLVDVFREARRVLKRSGTVWLNIGDCYTTTFQGGPPASGGAIQRRNRGTHRAKNLKLGEGLKAKELLGIPWRLAFALQRDGWYLRSDLVWEKPNAMPESVKDRPTRAHEYLFLLTREPDYFYDHIAIREPHTAKFRNPGNKSREYVDRDPVHAASGKKRPANDRAYHPAGRNKRSVWRIPTAPFRGAHFATFPPKLAETCIRAGSSEHGVCSRCGAPWERVTSSIRAEAPEQAYGGKWATAERKASGRRLIESIRARREMGLAHGAEFPAPITIRWAASCKCRKARVPATVLDPFGGSGTTLVEAERLGRSGIIIELNPEYAALARARRKGGSRLKV